MSAIYCLGEKHGHFAQLHGHRVVISDFTKTGQMNLSRDQRTRVLCFLNHQKSEVAQHRTITELLRESSLTVVTIVKVN